MSHFASSVARAPGSPTSTLTHIWHSKSGSTGSQHLCSLGHAELGAAGKAGPGCSFLPYPGESWEGPTGKSN